MSAGNRATDEHRGERFVDEGWYGVELTGSVFADCVFRDGVRRLRVPPYVVVRRDPRRLQDDRQRLRGVHAASADRARSSVARGDDARGLVDRPRPQSVLLQEAHLAEADLSDSDQSGADGATVTT